MSHSESRRDFLKVMGATSAVAVVGSVSVSSVFVQRAEAAEKSITGIKKQRSSCGICVGGRCGTVVTTQDGVVTGIEGDVEHPYSKGNLCARGNTQLTMAYNPYRVKAPMKRTNPKKGVNVDPAWVEISWEEALNTTAAKFKEAAEEDPRQMVFLTGFSDRDYPFWGQPQQYFEHIFEGANWIESNGPLCAIHTGAEMIMGAFAMNSLDITYCEYVLNFGSHLGPNYGTSSDQTPKVYDAYERGMKQYMIDPRCSTESSSGEWVPIKPGTDFACTLAILNVMMHEIEVYDTEFLKDHTNAPYLIGEDGFYLRNKDGKPVQFDLSDKTVKAFDDPELIDAALTGDYTFDGKKGTPSFVLMRESVRNYSPEWAEKICTIPAAKIREMTHGLIEHAHIGETITLAGVELPYRPVGVLASRGICCHANGAHGDLSTKLIMMLIGALDVPGALQANWRCESLNFSGNPAIQRPNADGVIEPDYEFKPERAKRFRYPPEWIDLSEFYPHKHSTPGFAFKSIDDPEKYDLPYRVKTFFSVGGNATASCMDIDVIERAIAKIPFTASVVYGYDEQAMLSDILLPCHSHVENMSVNPVPVATTQTMHNSITDDLIVVRTPAPTIYNTKNSGDITLQIIGRMGAKWLKKMNHRINETSLGTHVPLSGKNALADDKIYTHEEIVDRSLLSATKGHAGLKQFQEKVIDVLFKHTQASIYNYSHYPKRKTRYQLYFHTNKESGAHIVPLLKKHKIDTGFDYETMDKIYGGTLHWYDTIALSPPEGLDLLAVNYKVPMSFFRFGGQDTAPWLHKWADKNDPAWDKIQLNSATAKKKGFKEGDMLVLENRHGDSIQGRLHVTETCHPDSVLVAGSMGHQTKSLGKQAHERMHFNKLLRSEPGDFDPLMCAVEMTVPVKVYKA